VNVVVLVLAGNNRCDVAGSRALNPLDGVTVASTLLGKAGLNLVVVAVLVAAVLDRDDVVVVLFGEDLLVDHGLLGGVVVVLVNLLVDGGNVLLVLLSLDSLVLDSRGDLLVNSGVVLTRLGHEVLDGGFGGVHFVRCLLDVGKVRVFVVRSLFDEECVRVEERCPSTGVHVYILHDAYLAEGEGHNVISRHATLRVPKSMCPQPWSKQSGECQTEFVIGHATFRENRSQPTRET